jgi:hypothetical protein
MTEHKAKILKGRIIIALHEVLGRRPTNAEIERYYRAARVLYTTIIPTYLERQQMKRETRQISLP